VATNAAWIDAEIELLAGKLHAAEQVLRACCDACRGMGETVELSSRAAELAEALYLQGRYAEAEEWARVSQQHASARDLSAQIAWRAVAGKVLARRGELDDGAALAGEALALAEETDGLNQHAKTLIDLSEILRLAERFDEAVPLLDHALGLYRRKENRVGVARAEKLLAELVAA
jgi:tetratricopeptide (TPR) repeat protein